jgi:hypothetical protein
METRPACPVCGCTDQPWPVVEAGTGDRFCGDCHHDVMSALSPRRYSRPGHRATLREWRQAVADVRAEREAIPTVR